MQRDLKVCRERVSRPPCCRHLWPPRTLEVESRRVVQTPLTFRTIAAAPSCHCAHHSLLMPTCNMRACHRTPALESNCSWRGSPRERPRRCVQVHAAPTPDDSAGAKLYGDWREFRARLIAEQGNGNWQQRVSAENKRLLQVQNPRLAEEEFWAHPTTCAEKGGLLLATLDSVKILGAERLWQVVVLLVQHGPAGSVGLILNRPSGLHMGVGRGGLRFSIIGAPQGLQEVFAANRVYAGGMVRQDVFHVLHGHNLDGAQEIVPGVFVGGEGAAVKAVRDGLIAADDFKFFSGAVVWTGGELQREIDAGAWYTAAASRPIILKPCLQLPKPLWREVLECMGGEYAEVAAASDSYEY